VRIRVQKILLASFLLYAVVFAQAPKWAETNSHKNYPPSKYLLGVGIADEKTRAVELARADVAKQIQVKIESELETMEKETASGLNRTFQSEITSRTKSVVSETVAGIEIKETKRVKKTYYALAVLNKQNYLRGLQQEMDDISSAADQYIQSARELIRRGDLFAALDNYIAAQDEIAGLYVKRSLYTALSSKNYSIGALSPAEVQTEVRALLSGINLKITDGDNQTGQIGAQLKEPVSARIYYSGDDGQEYGLRQFPVIVKYGSGETIGKLNSDEKGAVSVTVVTSPDGSVIFTPDFGKIPERFRGNIPKIHAMAHYNIQSSNVAVAVNILNISGQTDPALNKKVSGLINENGYKIDPSASLLIKGKTLISNKRVINSLAGKQYFIELELRLALINQDSGAQLAAVTGSGKGLAVGSRDAAVLKAAENIKFQKSKFAAFLQIANQP